MEEDRYVRDLERRGPLQKVERGEAKILSQTEYPEPLKRFLARERRTLRLRLSASDRRKLERLSHSTGVAIEDLARRWIEQAIARQAG